MCAHIYIYIYIYMGYASDTQEVMSPSLSNKVRGVELIMIINVTITIQTLILILIVLLIS